MTETWQNLAEDAYRAAWSLRRDRHWRSMISRAYYAVYSRMASLRVARGVTMPSDREGPSHATLATLVRTHLTHLGDRRWAISGRVKALYNQRRRADYQPSESVDESDVQNVMQMMMDIFHLSQEKKP